MEKLNPIKKIFNKIYYKLFIENFKKKITFNFPENFHRWDLIDYLIKKKDYKKYLEIGCDKNQLFARVNIEDKIGVDPFSGGNIRKTSDEFFFDNNKNFDLVFIDGLHSYKQVKKDILNSAKFLNTNGIILVHDCLPDTMSKQAVPRYKMQWNGDVWKAIVDLRRDKNLEIFTLEADHGIAIIQKKKNTSILKIKRNIDKLKFRDFYKDHMSLMRILTLDDFFKLFN